MRPHRRCGPGLCFVVARNEGGVGGILLYLVGAHGVGRANGCMTIGKYSHIRIEQMLQSHDAVQHNPGMNKPLTEAERLIRELELVAHPEGGHYRETFRDAAGSSGRAHSTAIYFLLQAGEVSRWHRIDAAEVWHFHRGAPLELKIAQAGKPPRRFVLGARIEKGERPQIVVPPHAWQSARPLGDYTLAGCTVAPGFEFSKFELAKAGFEPK